MYVVQEVGQLDSEAGGKTFLLNQPWASDVWRDGGRCEHSYRDPRLPGDERVFSTERSEG